MLFGILTLTLIAAVLLLGRSPRLGLGVLVLALLGAASFELARPRSPARSAAVPRIAPLEEEIGSGACQSCHPSAYASWRASHHRSMTRLAGELPWDGESAPRLPAQLELDDETYSVRRTSDGRVEVEGPDLHFLVGALERLRQAGREPSPGELSGVAPRARRKLVQVTGSHHYLAFWLAGPAGRELRQLPFVFLLDEKRWAPRREVFLAPVSESLGIPAWNSSCIQCHAVSGRPEQTEGDAPVPWVHYDSSVTDLGIACEACHGPGRRHAEAMSSPLTRARLHELKESERLDEAAGELFIQNPARLSKRAASAVCGACHSYFVPVDAEEWWTHGFTRLPSTTEEALPGRALLRAEDPELARSVGLSRELDSIFWKDGSVRVGGREYNGLVASPCFEDAPPGHELGCLDCHSMHRGHPADQLRPDRLGDAQCTSCHTSGPSAEPGHSGHAPGSPGSACVACHMPRTSYALLEGIASHRISSPSHRLTEPPSACALCHVEATEAWLHDELTRLFPRLGDHPRSAEASDGALGWPRAPSAWSSPDSLGASAAFDGSGTAADARAAAFDGAPPALEGPRSGVPFAVQRLLSSHAAERALFVRAFVQPAVHDRLGTSWLDALLVRLEDDPYPTIRRIVARSRAELARAGARPPALAPPALDAALLDALQVMRDDRPIVISE